MRTNPGCILMTVGIAFVFVAACDPALPEQEFPDPATCADASTGDEAGFAATAQPIFETYCSWCHWSTVEGEEERKGAPDGIDYDSYSFVRNNTVLTWGRMKDRTMPPMGRLPSAEEYETILKWLSCADALRDASSGDDDDSAS
jgi:hypothetical protein